jgi:hypothetical protein
MTPDDTETFELQPPQLVASDGTILEEVPKGYGGMLDNQFPALQQAMDEQKALTTESPLKDEPRLPAMSYTPAPYRFRGEALAAAQSLKLNDVKSLIAAAKLLEDYLVGR